MTIEFLVIPKHRKIPISTVYYIIFPPMVLTTLKKHIVIVIIVITVNTKLIISYASPSKNPSYIQHISLENLISNPNDSINGLN